MVQVYDFEKDLSLTGHEIIKYNLQDVFGIEQHVEIKFGELGDSGPRAGSQEMFEYYIGEEKLDRKTKETNNKKTGNNNKKIGNSSCSDFNEVIKFIEFCYRHKKGNDKVSRPAINTAFAIINSKIKKIRDLIKMDTTPENIKIKLEAMIQMLENVKANYKAGKYENDKSFSVTKQTDTQNKLHTRVLVDVSDVSNRVGLRKTGEGEFEPLDGIATLFKGQKSSGCYKVEQNEDGTYTISKRVEGPEEKYEICRDLDEKTREAIVRVAQKNLEKLKQTEKEHKKDVPPPPPTPEDRTPKPKGHPTKIDPPKTSRGRVNRSGVPSSTTPIPSFLSRFGGVGRGTGKNPINIPPTVNPRTMGRRGVKR